MSRNARKMYDHDSFTGHVVMFNDRVFLLSRPDVSTVVVHHRNSPAVLDQLQELERTGRRVRVFAEQERMAYTWHLVRFASANTKS